MKKVVGIIIFMSLFLVGCGNTSAYNSYMEQGKTSVIENEYEKAKEFFSLALEEKKDDKEAKLLYEQINKLIEAINFKEDSNFEKSIELCEKIDSIDSKSDVIKNVVSKLKEECNEELKKIKDIDDSIAAIETLINEQKYNDAKENINNVITIIESNENAKGKLDKVKELLSICDNAIEEENRKKAEEEEQRAQQELAKLQEEQQRAQQESIVSENENSNKVHCMSGNHLVSIENYVEGLGRCHGCMIRRDLSSSAVNTNCTSCGSEYTVSQLTGVCSSCSAKVLPAVATINEDGTVILEDGTTR